MSAIGTSARVPPTPLPLQPPPTAAGGSSPNGCPLGIGWQAEHAHRAIIDPPTKPGGSGPPGGGIRHHLAVPGAALLPGAARAALLAGAAIPCCPSRKPARAACASLPQTLVFLLYQKGRDSRIIQT